MGRVSIVDRFACALGDHHWWPRPNGDMACQWCGHLRPLTDAAYADKGRWRWPDGASEAAA